MWVTKITPMIKQWLAKVMIRQANSQVFPIEELEQRHIENGTPDFNNSIYFAGVNPNGISLVTRMGFRTDKADENWLKICIPGEGTIGFENKQYKDAGQFKQGPLIYNCLKPGTEWQIIYHGYINEEVDEELSVNLRWKSDPYILNFGIEGTHEQRTIDQIVAKTWNKDFFSKIRGLGKVHYEQAGRITGTITYKGKTHQIDVPGIRDHNYGSRNYDDWNRHLWLIGILEDGRLFSISSVDYKFIEDLKAGFIGDCNQRRTTLWESPDLNEAIGEPALPKKLNFHIIEKKGGPKIPCSVKMNKCFDFTMDENYLLRQSIARFQIGDLKGTGIAELGMHKIRYAKCFENQKLTDL